MGPSGHWDQDEKTGKRLSGATAMRTNWRAAIMAIALEPR